MFIKVLSFDCANKSLAYTCAIVNVNIFSDLNVFVQQLQTLNPSDPLACIKLLQQLQDTLGGFIKVLKSGSLDVIEGLNVEDVDDLDRVQNLAYTLNTINIDIGQNDVVLIEDQPEARNAPSYAVQIGIQMYYAMQGAQIILVDPRKKNHLTFDPTISLEIFLETCRDSYAANKMHSSANFIHFIRNWKLEHMTAGLSKYDDVSDSFLQILVWFFDKVERRLPRTPVAPIVYSRKPRTVRKK